MIHPPLTGLVGANKTEEMNLKVLIRMAACCSILVSCISRNDTKQTVQIGFRPVIGYDTRVDESVPFPEDRTFNVWAQVDRDGSMYMDNETIAYNAGWKSNKIWLEEGIAFQAYWPLDIPVSYSKSEGIQINGFDCTSGDVDILVARAHSDASVDGLLVLPFDHLLSRIEFRMRHSLSEEMSVRVKKITISELAQVGDYNTKASREWVSDDYKKTTRVVFESEEGVDIPADDAVYVGDDFFAIPQASAPTLEVVYDVRFGTAEWIEQTSQIEKIDTQWEPSKHYTYTLNLRMDKMVYTTGISSWNNRE